MAARTSSTGRRQFRRRACLAAAAVVAAATAAVGQEIDIPDTQIQYNRGMHVAPIYEGWTRNDDGSYEVWFGYLNRNWEEVLHVPVGRDNSIAPGGPDRGQPTVFVPRRRFGRAVQRRETMVFSVHMPADWEQEEEVVWSVTANGRTDRAIGLLLPIYELPGPRGENTPPKIAVDIAEASVVLPATLELRAVASDDGEMESRRSTSGVRWVHYRGPGTVTFSPPRTPFPPEPGALEVESTTTAAFSEPGTFVLRALAFDGDWYASRNVTVTVTEQ